MAFAKTIVDGRIRLEDMGDAKTNDLGAYRIPFLPDGAYLIAVQPMPPAVRKGTAALPAASGKGFPPITFYPGTRVLDLAAPLEVRSGDERPAIDIAVQKEATRCIAFQAGTGFAGTLGRVMIDEWLGTFGRTFAEGAIAANGSYQVCGISPGGYRLHFYNFLEDKQHRLTPHAYQMAAPVVGRENVDLGLLEPRAEADIHGTLAVKDAPPLDPAPSGLRVRIVATEMFALSTARYPAQVQPDGTFVLNRALVGDYGIRVDGLPPGLYLISASQQGKDVRERGLWPANGDVQITLARDGAIVAGRVVTPDGVAVPDAAVFLVPKDSGPHLATQCDQTGAYRFLTGVPPGEYRIVAVSDLPGWKRQDAATAAALAAKGIDLKLGPTESRSLDLTAR